MKTIHIVLIVIAVLIVLAMTYAWGVKLGYVAGQADVTKDPKLANTTLDTTSYRTS